MNHNELMIILEESRSREADLPISRRVLLYRGLAHLCADMREAAQLRALAADLEAADRLCREFKFSPLPPLTKPNPQK